MGTVMTACMLVAILFTSRFPAGGLNSVSPRWLLLLVGAITALAAGWNVFWHAVRHLTDTWGLMALGSGLLMFCCAAYLLRGESLPRWFRSLRGVVIGALAVFAVIYAVTIYRL